MRGATLKNPKSVLTEKLVRAAAQDAGNRSMKKAGRTRWDEDDYNAAAKEYERLIVHVENPAVSAEQYGLALAVLSGRVRSGTGMTKEVAKEIVEKTPHAQRVKFAKELASRRGNPTGEPDEDKILAAVKKPHNRKIGTMAKYQQIAHDWGLYRVTTEIQRWMREVGATQEEMERHWKKNPKKKGPIGSALETLSGVGKYAVETADQHLGRMLNPVNYVINTIRDYDTGEDRYELRWKEGRSTQVLGVFDTYQEANEARKRDWASRHPNPGQTKVERFGREAEAKAYKRLLEAEGWKVVVEFDPDVPGEKWRATATKSNPKKNPEDTAADMYKSFHGKPSDSIEEYIEEEHYHGNLAQLGDLVELKVRTVSGYDVTLSFDGLKVILASNEDGTALYIVGGDQSLPLDKIHMDGDYVKDSMVIGEAYFISYFTEKDFDEFEPVIYEHEFGKDEDTGEKVSCPTLRYDHLNERLYLDGGEYVIKKPLFETSRGIEK